MKHLSLRARIIIALIVVALGTTLAGAFVTANFLRRTPQVTTSPEMLGALQDALELAKRDYEIRKHRLVTIEQRLLSVTGLRKRIVQGDADAISELIGSDPLSLRTEFKFSLAAKPGITRLSGPQTHLELRVRTTDASGSPVQIVVSDELSEHQRIEQALQTYGHLEMIIVDLREGLVRNYVLIVIIMVVLAGLIGLRIGLGITGPLSSLIRGTRELARDNLNYRIPPGTNDEIGILIESFNHMAGGLEENQRKRVEAEKVAAWREIARRLAHEIKNPLTPIQLTVQQMKAKYAGSDTEYQKLLTDCTEIVIEEVESLRGLVQEFAEFARMPQLALTEQDLNSVITDIVKLYAERKVELDLQAGLPQLRIDLEGMRRVLINLLQNAIDASNDRSAVLIKTELRDRWVCLSIVDEGHGIDRADRELIFEPYTSNKAEGTGLGLAVVRSIVQEHRGEITVADGPRGGARFDIQLPIPEGLDTPQETTS